MKSSSLCAALLVAFCSCYAPAISFAAEPTLSIQLVTEGDFRQEDARKWFAFFEEANIFGTRIRGGQRGDRVGIEPVGEPPTTYRITGIVNRRGQVDLPGGRFTLGDKAGLMAWAAKIKGGGEDALFEKVGAFGLTEGQLAAAKKELATEITFSTKGESPAALVGQVLREISPSISTDSSLQVKLEQLGKFPDELSGLSAGTVLAALLRPAGMALVPSAAGKEVNWQIVDAQRAKEVWPVGWKTTGPTRDYIPELLEFLPVEIENTPLSDVLAAIQPRLKVPFVVDQNALARERVDLTTTKVSLPKTNTFYQKVLERSLFQARLKLEVRIDEAEQPFLWITSIKQ